MFQVSLAFAAFAFAFSSYAADVSQVVSLKEIVSGKSPSGRNNVVRQRQSMQTAYAGSSRPEAEGCEVGDLGAEASVDASLTSTDCLVRDVVPIATVPTSIRPNSADVYRISVPRKAVLQVEMRSSLVDSYLYLLRGPSGAILARNDNGLGDKNAIFSIHLDPGTYLLVATSTVAGTGEYKLTSKLDAIRQCSDQKLEIDIESDGKLGDPDCRSMDLVVNGTSGAYLDRYQLEVTRRGVLELAMSSADTDTFVSLVSSTGQNIATDDDSGPGTDALLTASLAPGKYTVVATAAGTGSYKLLAKFGGQRECPANALSPGAVVTGDLASSDCRGLDIFLPSTDSISLDSYEIEITRPSLVTISMRSRVFDTYLTLVAPNGRVLTDNDDFEDISTNSQISISLPAGKYKILASAYEQSAGEYEIALATEDLRQCTAETIAIPGSRNGSLAPQGCRFLDFFVPSSDREAVQPYVFTLDKRSVVTLEARSALFDAGLILVDSKMNSITGNDNGAGGTNPKIDVLLNPGEYRVVVIAVEGQPGAYDLITSIREPKTCPADPIGTDATVTGVLAETDCRLQDFIPGVVDDTPADQYILTLTESRKVTLDVGSGDFVALAILLNDNFEEIEATTINVAPERATTVLTAGPGTYRIAVFTLTELGTYVLKTATQAP